mgnify:FL=1
MTRYDSIDFSPPQGVRDACLRGVALHEGGVTGDGIEPETVEWARKLARGVAITPSKARKMARFFGRNQRFAAEPKDSPAWASWQLWGGHAGDAWSEKLVSQMDAADEAQKMTDGIPTPANANDTTANDDAIVSVVDASDTAGAENKHPFPYTSASMADESARTLRGEPLAIEFADGGEASVGHSTWNQIARVGVFKGHPQNTVEFTPQVFDEIIANFRATKNGEVPGDYEHTSERLPPTVATDGVPAPFWVTDVATRNGDKELWAKFSWVDPQAVRYVRSKRYRYVSPAVNFNARSRETGLPIGARLTSVALTNHPFLDGMQPIAASANAGDHIATDALCAWLSLPSNATTEDIVKALSTRFSPSPDSTHAPTFGAPENARMEPEKKMADAPPPVADAAAPAAKPEADKDFGGKYRTLAARMAQCMSMEGFDPEAERAEDALIEQMTKIIGNLAEHQKREEAAAMAAAATMADRVIAAGLAESGAKDALTTLCLSQRATFDVLYPAAKIAAAEGSKTMSARSNVTRDAATILTQSVGAAGGAMHGTAGAATVGAEAPESHRLHNRAVAIMGERKVDLFTARKIAETEAATAAR